ncbi:MAG: FAD-dependent oxidoreductase [Gemmatimonadaceae bacterium]
MKRLLLAGGGHSHIEVLRRFALQRPCDTEITVVTPSPLLLYTGMWPGWIGGLYKTEECAIDVERLAGAANADFVKASVIGIDPATSTVLIDDDTRLGYDLLSLDIGATPPRQDVAGAEQHSIPVKPIKAFGDWWDKLLRERTGPIRVGIVGGGVGGIELALAMHHRLAATDNAYGTVFLVDSDRHILPEKNDRARQLISEILAARGIEVHTGSEVVAVDPRVLRLVDGARIPFDHLVWATGVAPPAWLASSGISLDERGFVLVDATLRSVSHERIFAAGDVAGMSNCALPKAGVYAVRQGPVLADNLRRALAGKPLAAYRPQRHALALIGTGERDAVAVRGAFALRGKCVWRWKELIDRRFVARYR